MSNLLTGFDWKVYAMKSGLGSDSKCVEHAIRASVALVEKKPGVFDWRRYIKDHPDLQRTFGTHGPVHVNDATCHYLSHGIKESRKKYILGTDEPYVYDFDWKMYDKLNPDVYTQRHRTNVGEWHCFRHWCEYGYKEDRKTGVEQLVVKTNASISTDEEVNKRWREALTILIDKSIFVASDDMVYTLINSIIPFNKLYYKLTMYNDSTIIFYCKNKEVFNVKCDSGNITSANHKTLFVYKYDDVFKAYMNDVFIQDIKDYDNIVLNTSNPEFYKMSINYPLGLDKFSKSNYENLDYLLTTMLKQIDTNYQINIEHLETKNSLLLQQFDQQIIQSVCNYIYVEKDEKYDFNRGYVRNLYKYLSWSDNILFSDIDIPLLNSTLDKMYIKMNDESYDVVKPYTNKMIYTNPHQKQDWIKNYTLTDDNFHKFASNLKNTTSKLLFTISGGITLFKRHILENIGGFNEINGYGYEDRMVDVHLLNTPLIKIYNFDDTLFHLYHDNSSKSIENAHLHIAYNKTYYNCVMNIKNKKHLHEFCNHKTKYLDKLAEFNRNTNGNLKLFESNNDLTKYSTLKRIPF